MCKKEGQEVTEKEMRRTGPRDHRGFRAARSKPHQPIIKKNWHEKPQDWLPCCVIGRSCRKHHLCHVIIHVLSTVACVCCDKTFFCHNRSMLLLYLSRQTKFCGDKRFVTTNILLLRQARVCHHKSFVASNIIWS